MPFIVRSGPPSQTVVVEETLVNLGNELQQLQVV
jgi:hypothetical protein